MSISELTATKEESREVWSIKWWSEKESKIREVCMISWNTTNGRWHQNKFYYMRERYKINHKNCYKIGSRVVLKMASQYQLRKSETCHLISKISFWCHITYSQWVVVKSFCALRYCTRHLYFNQVSVVDAKHVTVHWKCMNSVHKNRRVLVNTCVCHLIWFISRPFPVLKVWWDCAGQQWENHIRCCKLKDYF